MSPITIRLGAQFGTPYPRSAGFDTDIGAFIESSTVLSSKGLMAPSIMYNNAVQGEVFLPRQIFVSGGFTLRANSLGHLEQIDSYAPGHQVIFGILNYVADIRGDLIFDGFGPAPETQNSHDEHGLDLLSDAAQDITPAEASNLNPGQVASPKDGGLDPAPQAAHSLAVEPNIGLTSVGACNPGPPDSYPAVGPGPHTLEPAEPGWALVMEFTAADTFQHSPFGDILNSLKSLSLSGEPWPDYG